MYGGNRITVALFCLNSPPFNLPPFLHLYFFILHFSFFGAFPLPQAASGRAIRSYSPHTKGWFCLSALPFP